jgi:hypothetical protein
MRASSSPDTRRAALPPQVLRDPSFDDVLALIESTHGQLDEIDPAQLTRTAAEPAPPQLVPAPVLRSVAHGDLVQALYAATEEPRCKRSTRSAVRRGFAEILRDANEKHVVITQAMHDALATNLGKISPRLRPADRAQMVVAIARLAVDRLGSRPEQNPGSAKSPLAEAYARQAQLIPDDLEFTLMPGTPLSTVGKLVVPLPFEDQELYMEALWSRGVLRADRSRALEGMKAYRELTGFSLTAALCDPINGETLAERSDTVRDRYWAGVQEMLTGLPVVVDAIASRPALAAAPPHDAATDQLLALIDNAPEQMGADPFEQTMRALEQDPPQHTTDSPAAQGAPSSALRRVPSAELVDAFAASAMRRLGDQRGRARIGFEQMRAAAQAPDPSVAQRMHDALEAKLGKIGAGLQEAHRAQMIVAIARSAIERLGDGDGHGDNSRASLARSAVAEAYVRQTGLIPVGLRITLPSGNLLRTMIHRVVELPAEDQALYMEALCRREFSSTRRSHAVQCMEAYHESTQGRSLTADLSDPQNGSTFHDRQRIIRARFPPVEGPMSQLGAVVAALELRARQAAPPASR